MTVCLLVGLLVVPSVAVDDTQLYSYNGVVLPALPEWDKATYPYALLSTYDWFGDKQSRLTCFSKMPTSVYINSAGLDIVEISGSFIECRLMHSEMKWGDFDEFFSDYGANRSGQWSNIDIMFDDGTIYVAASDPVPVGDFVNPDSSGSTVPTATLSIETIHAGDDFMSSSVSVSDLESAEAVYSFRVNISTGGEVISTIESDVFSGPFMYWHITKSNLIPETEYTLDCVLLENGAETSVTVSQMFTTLAAEDEPLVDETEALSLLSAILAAIRSHADTQEQDNLTIISWFEMSWLRLRHIEQNAADILAYIKDLVPSKEESALKTATAETVTAVTKEFWGSDSDTAISPTNITESADVLGNVKNMFDIGVSTSDFFGLFGDSSWSYWFSEETRADLDTVPSVSTLDLYEDEEKSTYEKNLDAIRDFMGG